MLPNIYFTQITNLSEARFATSVMAKGIAFCIEKDHEHYASPSLLNSFKDWLVGSEWIAHLTAEPNEEVREVMDYFEIKTALFENQLYSYTKGEKLITEANKQTELQPLEVKEDFEEALKAKHKNVLLFGTKEEEVGMASMDRWLDYFEALEIL